MGTYAVRDAERVAVVERLGGGEGGLGPTSRANLIKAQAGPVGTVAWALRGLELHRRAERQGSPQLTLPSS